MGTGRNKLLLKNLQSPGDIVMLTAAVRDLKEQYPNEFDISVQTTAMELWEHNPYLHAGGEEFDITVECEYPLIHESNGGPWHFIHGFHQHLSTALSVNIRPSRLYGDVHLSDLEKSWMSQVQEITKYPVPFWIVVAGGKYDYTAKWWSFERYQQVIDHFREKILFVQVGENSHFHPPLDGVIDLRGKTDIRQLVRLVYHSAGILCPVTFLMHLAAAVPHRDNGKRGVRPCVVVAGGREPPQWEAYQNHQFLHTCGALSCCQDGGCWRSRVKALGDGDPKDDPNNLCANVVEGFSSTGSVETPSYLPKCMDMIRSGDVNRAIERYYEGGVLRYLDDGEREAMRAAILSLTA